MPSTSIAQQRLMGQAYALKTGELKSSDLDPKYRKQIEDLAASMTEKDLKDFAETSHKGLPQKVKENYTMTNNYIPTFENFLNEATVPKFSMIDYSKLSPREQQLHGELSQVIFSYKNLKKEEKLNAVGGLLKRIESGDLSEAKAIDVKYWEDYNTDTSGQGKKEHEVKSKDFEDTFEDAVVYWNQEADGAENRIKGAQIQKIKKLAQEFFKKEGWISVNVIQAMIAQES